MIICFDTESPVGHTRSGVLGLVCLTYALETDKTKSFLVRGHVAVDLWLSWVRDDSVTLLCHSAAHDMSVMAQAANPDADPGSGWAYELAWLKYDAGLVLCSYIRQRLIDIASGQGYRPAGLGPLVKRFELGDIHEKNPSGEVKKYLKTGDPIQDWPPDVAEVAPWRVKYGLFADVPTAGWPDEAREYALHDPLFGWKVFDQQSAGLLVNEREQTRAAFDLEILSKHGWLTDLPRVLRLLRLYGGVMAETYQAMIETGLVAEKLVWPASDPRHRTDRSLSTRAIQMLVWDVLGETAPLTEKAAEVADDHAGDLQWYSTHISADADTCTRAVVAMGAQPVTICATADALGAVEHFEEGTLRDWLRASGSEAINARRMYMKARHNVKHFLAPLETERRVRSRYTPLLETGRVSTSGPCLNYPRDADKPGDLTIRGCIVPDAGWPFIISDYAQLEMRTLAQALTDLMRWKLSDPGYMSTLAVAINDGMDVHVMVAASVLDMSYSECATVFKAAKAKSKHERDKFEQLVYDTRQVSKIANFGYGGGMGAKTFVLHAAKQGQLLTFKQAAAVKDAMTSTWVELRDYHIYIDQQCKRSYTNRCDVRLPRSGRVRGGCSYTQARNYLFQGPAADGCKEAIKRINNACFREPQSPLYGARPLAFIHDENICAVEAARAGAALAEMERHMVEAMRTVTPDVHIEVEGRILSERWSK